MKSFSNLTTQDNLSLAKSNNDRFTVYALDRINSLVESNSMNDSVIGLFKNTNNESKLQLVNNFYHTNYIGNYDKLIESFNQYTESTSDRQLRLDSLLESYFTFISDNAITNIIPIALKEAVSINANHVLKKLIHESKQVIKHIDVASKIDYNMCESSDCNVNNIILDLNQPSNVLHIIESLSNSVSYVIESIKCINESELLYKNNAIAFLESLNNVYNTYKEGMDLVQTQETQASELFNMFLNGRTTTFNFAMSNGNSTLSDVASFVQIGLRYFEQWLVGNKARICYKFPITDVSRLNDMFTIYEQQHPMLGQVAEFPEYYYSHPKMMELMDILLGMSKHLRMDLRNLVCKYITLLRPMIDSYYRDFFRSPIRTGV